MREILFKAKSTDNGEWVEGYYAVIGKNPVIIEKTPEEFFSIDDGEDRSGNRILEVDAETICQYTGLTDKNGKKIWGNDICIIHSSNIDEEDGFFTVEWDSEGARFALYGEGLTVDFDNLYSYECEVIGNIFDNPELLGGAE